MVRIGLSLAFASLPLLACGPGQGGGSESDSGTTQTTVSHTGDPYGTSEDPYETTAGPTATATGTGTGTDTDPGTSTDTDTDTGTDTGVDPCSAGLPFSFELIPGPGFGPPYAHELECEATSTVAADGEVTIDLAGCTEAGEPVDFAQQLVITGLADHYQSVTILKNSAIRLRYVRDTPMWTDEWFRIDDIEADRFVILGVMASALDPWEAPWDLYEPYEVDAVAGECPVADSPCGPLAREAIALGAGGEVHGVVPAGSHDIVKGGGLGVWGTFYTHVSVAESFEQVTCTDTPDSWYSFAVAELYVGE